MYEQIKWIKCFCTLIEYCKEYSDPISDDIIFTTALTDENGQVTLSWDAVEAGTISLTVMKRNYRPYEGIIDISTAAGAAIAVKPEDMYVNSGEEIDLSIKLHN